MNASKILKKIIYVILIFLSIYFILGIFAFQPIVDFILFKNLVWGDAIKPMPNDI